MRFFLNDVDSSYWWLSVVLVGLIINVASSYLKKFLDTAISKISETWKIRVEKKLKNKQKLISKLKQCDRSFHHYCMITTENHFRSMQNLILSTVVVTFGFIASAEDSGTEIIGYIGGLAFYCNSVWLVAKHSEAKSVIKKALESA